MVKLAVVVLNWNGIKFLKQYMPSIVEYTSKNTKIYVIDNASIDDSVSFLKENFPSVHIVLNADNYGFAKGYNEGLKHIQAEYYCLLNSDIEVTPNWDEGVIEFMDKHKDVAVCQPKLLALLQKDEFEYAGAAGGFIDKNGYPFCQGRLFSTMEKDTGQYNDNREIFWATGACMFVRSHIYHSLGGLDDDFFTHMEEIDFCWRVKNQGHKVMYYADSVVYHYGGGTLATGSPKKTYYNFRNNLVMLYKNLPSNRLFSVFCFRFIFDIIAGARFLIDSGINDTLAVIKAYGSFWANYSHNRRKRKQTVQQKHTTMMYKKNIVFQYFILKKTKFTDLNQQDFTN
ncbi:MAG: glycosyltransferase family 2 protein [Bacteroidales bacterium]|nr:glycosyltransferase family 2 protein [Bacteroidales bacterium]